LTRFVAWQRVEGGQAEFENPRHLIVAVLRIEVADQKLARGRLTRGELEDALEVGPRPLRVADLVRP
jgi:hypothetical protein